jgi:hypothetical protein
LYESQSCSEPRSASAWSTVIRQPPNEGWHRLHFGWRAIDATPPVIRRRRVIICVNRKVGEIFYMLPACHVGRELVRLGLLLVLVRLGLVLGLVRLVGLRQW